jgi:hypothetical protein
LVYNNNLQFKIYDGAIKSGRERGKGDELMSFRVRAEEIERSAVCSAVRRGSLIVFRFRLQTIGKGLALH